MVDFKKWMKVIVLSTLILLLFLIPLPLYFQGPGAVFETDKMIQVEGQEAMQNDGELYMTTVSVVQATPISLFLSFHPHYTTLTENEFLGGLENSTTYFRLQEYLMTSSIHTAQAVALQAADMPVAFESQGVYVLQIVPESDFFNKLEIGDLILEVNNHSVENSGDLTNYIEDLAAGATIELTVKREENIVSVSGQVQKLSNSGEVGIGIGLVDNTSLTSSPDIEVNAGEVGGPSAGLMYSLQIYSQLTGIDLTHGYEIAGTGTIDLEGQVGPIGGVDKKVVAADDEGVDYFLAPSTDYDAKNSSPSNYSVAQEKAKDLATEMEIIPVESFQDALNFLESLSSQT